MNTKLSAFRIMPRLLLGVLAIALIALAVPPAEAAARSPSITPQVIGNGCFDRNDVAACVSYSASFKRVSRDFYLNSSVPWCYTATLTLTTFFNGIWHSTSSGAIALDHLGRYPELHISTGNSSGTAYSRVNVYNCGTQWLYGVNSPVMQFP